MFVTPADEALTSELNCFYVENQFFWNEKLFLWSESENKRKKIHSLGRNSSQNQNIQSDLKRLKNLIPDKTN